MPDPTDKKKTEEKTVKLGNSPFAGADPIASQFEARSVPESIETKIDLEDYEKYTGSYVNPFIQDLDKMRAQEQGFWEQAGRSAIQTGAEIIGGSFEGAGYILDIPDTIIDVLSGAETDFGNAISEFGRSIREGSKEEFAIYQENPGGFNFFDPAWWLSNAPTIASTLSLYFPAMGATKLAKFGIALGKAGRTTNLASKGLRVADKVGELANAPRALDYGQDIMSQVNKLSRAQKGQLFREMISGTQTAKKLDALGEVGKKTGMTGEVIANAAFSRVSENMMNAVPMMEELDKRLKKEAPNLTEEQRNEIVTRAGWRSFMLDSAFLLQDLATFRLLKGTSRAISGRKLGTDLGGRKPTWKGSTAEMASEGFEESWQYGVEKESNYFGDRLAGIADETAFSDRLSSYMTGEMFTGAFFGALGSGVFRAIGSQIDSYADRKLFDQVLERNIAIATKAKGRELTDDEVQTIEKRSEKQVARKNTDIVLNLENANELINEQVQQAWKAGLDIKQPLAISAINNALARKVSGKQDMKSIIDTLSELDEDSYNQEFGGEAPISQSDLRDIQEVVDQIPEMHDRNMKYGHKLGTAITRNQAAIEYRKKLNEQTVTEIETQLNENQTFQSLTQKGQQMARRKAKIEGLKKAKKIQKKQGHEESVEWLDNQLKKEQEIYKRWKSKERKTEDELNDQTLLQSLESDLETIADKQSKLAISQSAIDMYSNKIKKFKDAFDEAQKEVEQKSDQSDQTEDTSNQKEENIDPEDAIDTLIESPDDVKEGDRVSLGGISDQTFPVIEKEGIKKIIINGDEKELTQERIDKNRIYKRETPEEKNQQAKSDLKPWQEEDVEEPIPDDYEDGPPKNDKDSRKETIQSAAWKSIHNPDNQNKEDPDEIARTNWAESPISIFSESGPRYYVKFETEGEDITSSSVIARIETIVKDAISKSSDILNRIYDEQGEKAGDNAIKNFANSEYNQAVANELQAKIDSLTIDLAFAERANATEQIESIKEEINRRRNELQEIKEADSSVSTSTNLNKGKKTTPDSEFSVPTDQELRYKNGDNVTEQQLLDQGFKKTREVDSGKKTFVRESKNKKEVVYLNSNNIVIASSLEQSFKARTHEGNVENVKIRLKSTPVKYVKEFGNEEVGYFAEHGGSLSNQQIFNLQEAEYEIDYKGTQSNITSEEVAIRAYVVDKTTGNKVTENDRKVFFYVHKPTFTKTKDKNPSEVINNFRKDILDALERGEQPVAPITKKTAGVFRWKGDDKDVLSITGYDSASDTPLAILSKQLKFRDSTGVHPRFRKFEGNKDQVGRVYTVIEGLNGVDKDLPLERKTLNTQMINAIMQITSDMTRANKPAKPGDTISDQLWNSLENIGDREKYSLKKTLGNKPTYKQLLDHLVLEGPITKGSKQPEKKIFHINFDKNQIEFGENAIPFAEFTGNNADLREFLQQKRINVLRSEINKPAYNEYLINNKFIYQTNKLPLLIQPSFHFGSVHILNKEVEDTAIQEASEQTQQSETNDNEFTHNPEYDSDINSDTRGYSRIPVARGGPKKYAYVYAKPVEIESYDDYNFWLYKHENGNYSIVEESTGQAVITDYKGTQKDAISDAKAKIDSTDFDTVVERAPVLNIKDRTEVSDNVETEQSDEIQEQVKISEGDIIYLDDLASGQIRDSGSPLYTLFMYEDIKDNLKLKVTKVNGRTQFTQGDPSVNVKLLKEESNLSEKSKERLNYEVDNLSYLKIKEEVYSDKKGSQQSEEKSHKLSDDDVNNIMGDMLQRSSPLKQTKSLKPVLEGLKERTGIGYVMVNNPNLSWAGKFENGVAFINTAKAGNDTPFHEYAHPIIRQIKLNSPILYTKLVHEIGKDQVYKDIRKKVKRNYPDYSNEQVIEETLVQIIGQKAATTPETQSYIRQLWNKIKDYLKSIFTSVDINQLDEGTTLQDLADLISGNQFINVEMNPMAGYQIKPNDMSYSEWNSWINSMIFMLLNGNQVTDYKNADQINWQVIVDKFTPLIGKNDRVTQIINSLFNDDGTINKESRWYKGINDKLAKFEIVPDRSPSSETVDSVDSPDYQADYMFAGKDKASTFIKMMFSTVPKIKRIDSNGNKVYEKNKYTNLPEYHNFNDIWNLTSKILSDTVNEFDNNGQTLDIFDRFIDNLKSVKDFRPEVDYLIRKFEGAPQWKKSKFVNAFYQASQNYSLVLYDGNNFRIKKQEPSPAEEKLEKMWEDELNRKWFDKNGNVSKKRQDKLETKYNNLKKAWNEYYNDPAKQKGPVEQQYKQGVQSILNILGFNLSDKGLEYLIRTHRRKTGKNYRDALNYYITEEGLNRLLEGRSGILTVENNNSDKNFINNQKASQEFIEAEAFFSQDLGSASLFGPGNNSYYNFSSFSMMGKLLKFYQENPSKLDQLSDLPFYGNSKWREHIDKLNLTNNYAFRSESSYGQKMKDVGEIDRLFIDINKILSGQFSMMARGANATEFNISGAPVERIAQVSTNGEVRLQQSAIEDIADYIYDEIERIRYEKKFIAEENRKAEENKSYVPKLIDGYHTEVTDPATGDTYIPALKTYLMPNVMEEFQISVDTSREKFKSQAVINKNEQTVYDRIEQAFETRAQELLDYFENNNITQEQANKKITDETKEYASTSSPLKAKIYDYLFNGMVSNIEQQKLFAADTAMFAPSKDGELMQSVVGNMQKRILANGSMGQQWYVHPNENEWYNSAVIKDISYDSKIWDNYKGIEVTDAQAWVTLPFYVDALKGFGKWGPEMDEALYNIETGNFTQQDIDLFTQPLKTVAFERVIQDGRVMPIYDKQTILPLIPSIIEGTSLQNLLNNMNDQDIDHVTVESGKKLGRLAPSDAIDPKTGQFRETFYLEPITQSKHFTFLQTEMPTKGIGSSTQGSQQKYNILSALSPTSEIFGKNARGLIHRIQGSLSDIYSNEFMDNVMDENGKVDQDALYNKLIELSTTKNIDRELIEYLESGVPIEAIPAYNVSLQNKVMALLRDLGASFDYSNQFVGINASIVGFGDLTNKERQAIDWIYEDTDLKPPTLKDGNLTAGDVLMPHSFFQKYGLDPNNSEHIERAQELLQGIGYRIPNQALSNIAPLRIKGILPKSMGDTIVPYGEIIDQMGTDNDGDKTYVMMYNLEPNNPAKVKYWDSEKAATKAELKEIWKYRKSVLNEDIADETEFINKYEEKDILTAQSKKQVENYLLDSYSEIFSKPEVFEQMQKKLEDNSLENDITSHKNYEQRNIGDLEYASPFFQAKIRDSFLNANSGVGLVSNHIIDHIKSLYNDIHAIDSDGNGWKIKGINTNTTTQTKDGKEATLFDEVENVDGKRIDDILSLIMNAQVDAEKDDYAPRGNFNTQTLPIILAMVRAGVSQSDIVDNVGSKIVRDYTKYKQINKNTLVKDGIIENRIDPLEQTAIDNGYFQTNDDGNPIADVSEMMENENDLRVYRDFEIVSQSLSQSIQMTRFSVNGGGRSFPTAVAMELFLDSEVPNLANVKYKFDMLGGKSIERKSFENTVLNARRLFENQSIAFGSSFYHILNKLEGVTNFKPINLVSGDATQAEEVYFGFYNYIMSGVFNDVNREQMISGDNTVADRVRELQKTSQNKFIQHLIPNRMGQYDFIQTGLEAFDEDSRNEIMEAWEDLLNTNKDLALDLGRLAYFQSGFKRNFNSFHELMPKRVSEALEIPQRYMELQSQDTFDGFIEQYIRHNIENNDLVPFFPIERNENNKITSFRKKKEHVIMPAKDKFKNKENSPYPFFKRKETTPAGSSYLKLFEYIGTNKNGEWVYGPSPKLGYSQRGQRFYEYDLDSTKKTPIFNKLEYPNVSSKSDKTQSEGANENKSNDWKEINNNDQTPFNKECN